MRPLPRFPRPPLALLAGLLTLLAVAAPPAAAIVQVVRILPADPTVCDPVGIEVDGMLSPCHEIVGAEIYGPIPADPACMGPVCPARFEIRIRVREPEPGTPCLAVIEPYRRAFRVGALPAGAYVARATEIVLPWSQDSTAFPRDSSSVAVGFWVKPAPECPPAPGCYILGFHPSDMPGVMMPSPVCTITAPPGGTACLQVMLYNTTPVAGVQSAFAIYDPRLDPLPGGPVPPGLFTFQSVEAIGLAKDFTVNHTVGSDGVVTVILYSPRGASLPPGAGPILRLCYDVSAQTPLGEYPIVHQNEVVSDPDGSALEPCPTFRETSGRICVVRRPACDVNGDGESNILDVIRIVRCVLAAHGGGEACPDTIAARADCNGDGVLDVRDVVCCVRRILRLRAEGPSVVPVPIGSFPGPGDDATTIGFVGDAVWASPVEGRATLRIQPGSSCGGAEWVLYADPARVLVRNLALRSAEDGVRLEWMADPSGSGVVYAMLFAEGGAAMAREVLIDAVLEPVVGGSGPTKIVVAGLEAATMAGLPAMSGVVRPTADVPTTAVPAPAVYPARPNPFVGQSDITFALPAPGRVTLRLYDVRGRLVRTLVNESRAAGVHHERWDGRDDAGRDLASGVYLLQFRAGGVTRTERLLRLR